MENEVLPVVVEVKVLAGDLVTLPKPQWNLLHSLNQQRLTLLFHVSDNGESLVGVLGRWRVGIIPGVLC